MKSWWLFPVLLQALAAPPSEPPRQRDVEPQVQEPPPVPEDRPILPPKNDRIPMNAEHPSPDDNPIGNGFEFTGPRTFTGTEEGSPAY